MTDEPEDTAGEPDVPAGGPDDHRRRSAAAASRARRIGGRVRGTASRPDTEAAVEPAEAPAKRKLPSLKKRPTETEAPVAETPEAWYPPPAYPPPPPAAPRGAVVVPWWLRWLPAGVLSAGAIVMAILLLVFSNGIWWAKPSGAALREQVLAAAKTCLATTNTYKYTELNVYEQKSLRCVAGPLTKTLRHTIEALVKVNAPKIQAQQTAQINTGGIESISSDGKQWTVLIFGQLAVTNTNYPQGRTDPFGAQVRMEKFDGQWLMTNVRTVSSLS